MRSISSFSKRGVNAFALVYLRTVEMNITGLQGCKLFFFELTVKCHTLVRAAHDGLYNIILIMTCKLR